MKKKLKLNELGVQSFVTQIPQDIANQNRGGAETLALCGLSLHNDCSTHPPTGNCPTFNCLTGIYTG